MYVQTTETQLPLGGIAMLAHTCEFRCDLPLHVQVFCGPSCSTRTQLPRGTLPEEGKSFLSAGVHQHDLIAGGYDCCVTSGEAPVLDLSSRRAIADVAWSGWLRERADPIRDL